MNLKKRLTPLVLFYTNTPRAFRTTLIGYLYEIANVYDIILLSEDLDQETTKYVSDKKYFPNIVETIAVHQHTGPTVNIVRKHRYLCNLAKRVMTEYKPDIVIASSDWHSIFEMYLMRFAGKMNALRITLQDTFNIAEMKDIAKWVDLSNIHERTPSWLPYWFRYFAIQTRGYAEYLLCHFFLPIMAGQTPFCTVYSYVLFTGCSGCGDTDYHVVLSERDYVLHKLNGVPESKLRIMTHPINRGARDMFSQLVRSHETNRGKKTGKVLVLLPAEEMGFREGDYGLISKTERTRMYVEILRTVLDVLVDCTIVVKPHPLIRDVEQRKKDLTSISSRICFAEPWEPAENFIEEADVIMELPRAASTALFTATLQCPEKPTIALNLQNEFLGDCYRNFAGVEYVNDNESLRCVLKRIASGTYAKGVLKDTINNNRSESRGTLADLLSGLYKESSGDRQKETRS